jgi:hypothetical protein
VRSGQVKSGQRYPCWQSVSFISPFPFLSFRFPNGNVPSLTCFLKTKFKSYCTPTLTPISRNHQPISGLGPSVDIELLSTRCLIKKTSTAPCSCRSGLGRKPEWDSNTLISLNKQRAPFICDHDWAARLNRIPAKHKPRASHFRFAAHI